MRTIQKFHITSEPFLLPAGSRYLDMQQQGRDSVAWFEVDTDRAPIQRRFVVYWTGHTIDPGFTGQYLGTLQAAGLVHHVYLEVAP